MISVSDAYKQAMEKPVRDRAYISVGIGVVNQSAQGDGILEADKAYWSKGNVFDANAQNVEYATLEEHFLKTDGTMLFLPEENAITPLLNNGIVTNEMLGVIKINFAGTYAIKGITLEFGSAYPTKFRIKTAQKDLVFENYNSNFETTEVLGDTNYIEITPLEMVGGQQRFRLQSILMGVGLALSNKQTKDMTLTEYISSISQELPSQDLSYSFCDENSYFNVDDENSFVEFLETMQKVTLSFGVTLNNGEVEWNQFATTYLKDWKIKENVVTFTATDRLSQMEDEYSLANRIYQRTAYEEAQSIFTDAGLEPDEYYIDDYLQDITLNNPMPEGTHKECLQLLANACRCIIRQDENGIIKIVANFAVVLDPSDLTVTTNGVAAWSNPENILIGTSVAYADMTQDFFETNGSMYFLPEDSNYLETAYVSDQMSDTYGLFETNPTLTISMPAAYTYFNVNIDFGGNPPEEMIIHIYKSNMLKDSVSFSDLKKENLLIHEFSDFDTMVFEFAKGYPNNRILVNSISFSDLSDFVLTKSNMMSQPIGYREKRVKATRCKIYSYTTNEDGEPEEVEDNVYATKVLGSVGEIKTLQNPLVSTQEHAELLAEWVGNYFANNVSYDVDYRGDPRNNAADIIHMESDVLSNLQVEIEKHTLNYNGAFSGSMELRKALKIGGG